MSKTQKITISVLSVVLVLAVAFLALTMNDGFLKVITGSLDVSSGEKLDSLAPVSFNSDYPLVQTEQKDLFYEANPDGTFRFYKFANGGFTEVKDGVKTKNVTLTCSYQNVKVKLYYLPTEAGTVGYGLFNSQQKSDTKLFSYIFVRLMDCPEAYSKTAKTKYVLLTDMDAEDAYKPDKTYSDMYSYNMDSGKATLVVSQRDRLVQEDGTVREDWTIFTDSMLNVGKKYDLFASARTYDTKAETPVYDFLTVANSRAASKNSAATFRNSPSYIIREKDGAYYCFANTDEGFDLVKNGDKKAPLASFDGKFSDYAVNGNILLNKASLEATDITTGEKASLKKASFTELSGFISNESGTKFVLFCNGETQSMVTYDTQNGETKIITDNIFDKGICNFCFIDDSTALFSSYDENGAAVNKTITL